jgi:cyclase
MEAREADPRIQQVGPGTYAVTGLGHPRVVTVNAGFVIARSAVVSIDAGMSISDGVFLWDAAHELAPGAVRSYLVLTHHHSDHTFGMRVFRERGAEIVAHARVRAFLEDDRGRYKAFIIERYIGSREEGDCILGDVVLSVPDRLIEADTFLDLDGEAIRLLAVPGHVPSELCVYVPRSKVLFAGDAVYEGMRPNTRFAGPAQRAEWVRHPRRVLCHRLHPGLRPRGDLPHG